MKTSVTKGGSSNTTLKKNLGWSVGGVLVQISGVFTLISECFISNSLVRERRSREEGLRKERSAAGAAAEQLAAERAAVA